MLAPIYSLYNLLVVSLSTLLWGIQWLFTLVAFITFIGFINVRFFTKNNNADDDFNKILEREEKLAKSQRQFLSLQRSLSSNFPSDDSDQSDEEQHDIDTECSIDSWYSRSARRRAHRARRKLEIPTSIKPSWNVSPRLSRQDTPPSQQSPSESMQSTSVSQYKSSKMFEDDSDHHTALNGSSLLSPDIDIFKLTQRIPKKTQCDNSAENHGCECELNVNEMQSFQDIYNFLVECVMNNVEINESVKCQVQECINKEAIELKSFEKALLESKLSEV